MKRPSPNYSALFWGSGSLLAIGTGCGQETPTCGKVSGRVVSNSQPVQEAIVLFHEPTHHRYIQATTDVGGNYQFDKHPGGGLPVGNYFVAVQPPLQEIETGKPLPPPKPFPKVPAKIHDPVKSGLKLEVKPGDNPFDIDLRSPW